MPQKMNNIGRFHIGKEFKTIDSAVGILTHIYSYNFDDNDNITGDESPEGCRYTLIFPGHHMWPYRFEEIEMIKNDS